MKKSSGSGGKSTVKYRDNRSGEFVKPERGKANPGKTTREHVPKPGYGTESPKR